jgi:hypothetical protein
MFPQKLNTVEFNVLEEEKMDIYTFKEAKIIAEV